MRPDDDASDFVVKFHRIYPAAIPPMRADASALGTLPAASFQYCQPVRTASAYGWYVFPPADIRLTWDGTETLYEVDGEWRVLTSAHLSDEFLDYWDANAPEAWKGRAPPYLTSIFSPGVVQIWSGLLVSTSRGWSVHIRPLANITHSRTYACFEGIIESDEFKPCPLFINLRLLTTDREIMIPRQRPLFQVQPLQRVCYADATQRYPDFDALARESGSVFGLTDAEWQGLQQTVRSANPEDSDHTVGSYGARVRRRAKRADD